MTDLLHLHHRQPDVVKTVEKVVLAEGVDFKRVGCPTFADDLLRFKIDLDLLELLRVIEKLYNLLPRQRNGHHSVLHAVRVENIRKRRADDAPDPHPVDGPGRVLPRRPAPKVVSRDDDLCPNPVAALPLTVLGPIQHKVLDFDSHTLRCSCLGHLHRVLVPQLCERRKAKAGALDRLEVLLRDDHVGVNVLDVKRCGHALQIREDWHSNGRAGAFCLADDWACRFHSRRVLCVQ
mmetsp:Transcript_13122/g.29940  ORF Transcript_13122/g.29940 Transcript_13122/m.29940 type:complete len:235 (-) Transcript_13122:814-1518(-)